MENHHLEWIDLPMKNCDFPWLKLLTYQKIPEGHRHSLALLGSIVESQDVLATGVHLLGPGHQAISGAPASEMLVITWCSFKGTDI